MVSRRSGDWLVMGGLAALCVLFWGNCLWGGRVPVAAVYQQQMLPWSAEAAAGTHAPRQWDALLWDSMAQFYPWRQLLHRAGASGELPLWNPSEFCGYPFVGNGQSAIFYPLNWLYFLLPAALGLGLSAALHYVLAALFVFGLGRTLGLGRLPAAFSALAFTFGGFMVTWIELPTLVNSLIWLPLAWWGLELIFRGRPVRGTIMTAAALGMTLLAGHFQIAAYVWLFTFAYAFARLLYHLWRRRRALVAAWVAAGLALGLMLALVQVLPTLELGALSARGGGGPSAAGFAFHRARALQPLELMTLLSPDLLGSPVHDDYRGISYSEHCGFVGAVTLALGVTGLLLGWRRKHCWLLAGIAVFCLWGAMGGLPAVILYWGVPKLGQAGGFSRLLSVWTLAAALCGGLGLQVLTERLPRLFWLGPAILAILAAELLPWAYAFNPRGKADTIYAGTAATAHLQQVAGFERYLAITPRADWGLFKLPWQAVLPPNSATAYGLATVAGYDSLFPAAYGAYAGGVEGALLSPAINGNMLLMNNPVPWAKQVGLKYVLAAADWPAPPSLQTVWEGAACRLYATDPHKELPGRAWFEPARGDAAARQPRFVPLTPTSYSCDQIAFDLPEGDRGWLRLRDTLYPGWLAFADGRQVRLAPYEKVFRQVNLSGRERQVTMVYYPAGVAVGGFAALLGLCFLVALGVAARTRREAV